MAIGGHQPTAAAIAGTGPLSWLTAGPLPAGKSYRARVVCVPAAGGTVAAFHEWVPVLGGQGIAVGAADWSGESPGQPDSGDGVRARARALAEATRRIPPPWVLVGHSFGGLIAYEAVRRLEASGWPRPHRLVLCAARPPHHPEDDIMAGATDADIAERLRLIASRASPALAHPLLRRLLVARIRSDIRLAASYRHAHAGRLRCPALIYGGSADVVVPGDMLGHWSELLADCQVRMIAGGHSFLHDDVRGFLSQLLADTGLASSVAGDSRRTGR
jgi:surfactin synthase thioesterase subunit